MTYEHKLLDEINIDAIRLLSLVYLLMSIIASVVEPQISHFANFTQCEELVPKRHFWKM